MPNEGPGRRSWTVQSSLLPICILHFVGAVWFAQVQKRVPEAYLDEVFHIRQAKVYWNHQWTIWDPKITTPPGLYICGYLWMWITNLFKFSWDITVQLRCLNLGSGLLIYHICRFLLDYSIRPSAVLNLSSMKLSHHTVLNITLFPPLFFFYALYYTDVLSAALILVTYGTFRVRMTKTTLLLSLATLSFRQTNIFWVAIFFGGLELVRNIQQGRLGTDFPFNPSFSEVVRNSWQTGCLYDPLVNQARFEDYLKCGISLAMLSLASPRKILVYLLPYLSLLGVFGAFVLWNGGVVLGDKSNHVASIHVSQMLYIWPYFTFFSIPVLYPYFLALLSHKILPSVLRPILPQIEKPRRLLTVLMCIVMAIIIHFNTIVHPFTLADNRHYTFYVFRLLLRQHLIKYLVVPVYFTCAWATTLSIGGIEDSPQTSLQSVKSMSKQNKQWTSREAKQEPGNRTSFVLIWFLSTSLSLITAPLVEPRYFIIPWLFWRLHLHTAYGTSTPSPSSSSPKKPLEVDSEKYSKLVNIVYQIHHHHLWLETIWFLLINAVTGYIFLNWGFEWEQEPGNVQRFMW